MNTPHIPTLSEAVKGNLLFIAGIILLLHTLKVSWDIIYYLTIVGAIYLIGYGFVKAGYYQMLLQMIKRKPDTHN